MRLTSNRLTLAVLVPALAAGLLASVFVRPEPALTAADDCYGTCRTVTTLELSRPIVRYGHEQSVSFRVDVRPAAPGEGVPAGHVVVLSRAGILCQISLVSGKGSCSPSARALPPGLHEIVARYAGRNGFEASTSGPRLLLVVQHRNHRRP